MSAHIFVYVSCPYCASSILLKEFRRTKFDINPLEFHIIHKREQKSGRGYSFGKGKGKRGFFLIEGSQKTIQDLLSGTEEEREIAQKIIARVKKICEAYQKLKGVSK